MSRINGDIMNMQDVVIAMSDGNPGAFTAMVEMMQCKEAKVDLLQGWYPLLTLDEYEIYGTDIYVLWNDLCDRDADKAVELLQAVQRGDISSATLKDACGRQDYSGKDMIDWDKVEQ